VELCDPQETGDSRSGFTLIEMVAAFAIGSVVIFAAAALLHNMALSFDRGASRVAGGERLAIAAQRLGADIASAAFIFQKTPTGIAPVFSGAPGRVVFISFQRTPGMSRRNDAQFTGQEVVSLSVEAAGDMSQIVRRRGAWPGPRTPLQNVALNDDVVLLEGAFDAAFKFARPTPDGTLNWVDTWGGEPTVPRLIKLAVRDRVSGIDLLGGAEFALRADAPFGCAVADASIDCLSGRDSARAKSTQQPTSQPSRPSQ